ncbi:MAG TPA: DUF3570 domain-containing protein [Albitalea sp.]|nr:DUF3570 domain-containing protein [Albitalea sp.]
MVRLLSALRRRRAASASRVATVVGGVLAGGAAHAVTLPEDTAEAMIHVYQGGGITASGPAVLVRKNVADKVSLTGSYYVDMVSNASIDVVTTASPYRERRDQVDLGVDYAYRDALVTLSTSQSKEPDYKAGSASLDISQEVFGGMTTVALGFTRGADKVGKKGVGYFDTVKRWQYRLGVTQILTPRWLMSANVEAISDDGFLGSPYRVARVFGAAVPERDPRTRSSRAVKLRAIGDIGEGATRAAVRGEYRYFWDNWAIKAHTAELGYTRYFGEQWLADAYVRLYSQRHALFYSDNAATETLYVSRNRQLSTFHSVSLGAKVSRTFAKVPGRYEVKAHMAYELMDFRFSDFTDIRTGSPYSFTANVLQVYVSASF